MLNFVNRLRSSFDQSWINLLGLQRSFSGCSHKLSKLRERLQWRRYQKRRRANNLNLDLSRVFTKKSFAILTCSVWSWSLKNAQTSLSNYRIQITKSNSPDQLAWPLLNPRFESWIQWKIRGVDALVAASNEDKPFWKCTFDKEVLRTPQRSYNFKKKVTLWSLYL